MHLVKVKYCLFIIFTLVDIVVLKVRYDEDFTQELIAKLLLFEERVVIPEILSGFFYLHKKELMCDIVNENVMPCDCQTNLENAEMIRCARDVCQVRLFHKSCLIKKGV
jgi:hypothetical protein